MIILGICWKAIIQILLLIVGAAIGYLFFSWLDRIADTADKKWKRVAAKIVYGTVFVALIVGLYFAYAAQICG